MKEPYLRNLERRDKVTVWLVNGKYVREHFYLDFTQGGHGYVYDFIPLNEVWIDDDLSTDERPYVIAHEFYERALMKEGVTYDTAHTAANVVEKSARHITRLSGRKND